MTFRDHRMREEYIAYIQEKKGPLFLMNPDLFQKFGEEMKSEKPGVAREAIRPLLNMFCLRRGMLTPTTMPDGTTVVPSEGIPRMHIRTVNVQPYNDEDQNDLYRIIKKHYPKLFYDSWDKGKDIGHGTFDKAQHLWPNPTIVRTLALSTTNVEFYPLTLKPSGEDDKDLPSALNSPIGQKVTNNKPCLDRLNSLNLPEANAATTETKDRKEIEKVLAKDGVGGLLWYLSEMHQDQNVEFPESRQDIVKTFCARSPKVCWTVKRVLELKEHGHRVLVFVDNPLTSLILAALLTSIGVTTLNIRSSNKPRRRAEIVSKFNDPDEKIDALVVSFQLDGFGMNLQGACHHGIVVEYPDNIPTLLHGFGRLWRIGQKREVHWDVLYMENSFDGWDETWMVSKYADILAAEGEIPDEIQGEHRVICAFELIKRYLGQDSNRYPRTRVTWAEQEHPLVAREGHFYSALATYLMQNPGRFKEVGLKPLSLIARRWSPEQGELTLDMIEGNSPELEDGVMLDSRNPLKPGYVASQGRNKESGRKWAKVPQKISFTTPRGIDGKVPEEADTRPETNELATQPISEGMMEISIDDTIQSQQETAPLEQVFSYWESPSNLITDSPIDQNTNPAYQPDHTESSSLPQASIPFILGPQSSSHGTGQDLTGHGQSQDPFELTEREAFLFMTYIHKLAPLSDACDDARHFALEVPRLALHQPMIMNGLLALASRYDSRCTNTSSDIESTFYHNKCIKLLIEAFTQPPETWDSTLLTAVVIARLYEENDNETDSYYHHLSGTQNLLNHEVIARFVMQGGLAEAASWVHLRQAIYVYVVRREPLEICLENFERSTVFRRSDDSAYANRAVYNFAKLMRLFLPMESPDGDLGKWGAAEGEIEEWYDARPVSFKPIFHKAADISSDRPFPVICFAASVPGE
nr:hypothetical protein FVER53263_09362 [Fusarium verticillioides]